MLRRTLVLAGLLLSACSGDSVDPAIPTALAKLGGDGQNAEAGAALPLPLQVMVTNVNEDPVEGVVVSWFLESGSGSLSASTSTTNAQGLAQVNWTLGGSIGAQEVRVLSGSLDGSPAIFRATATDPDQGGGGGGPPPQ